MLLERAVALNLLASVAHLVRRTELFAHGGVWSADAAFVSKPQVRLSARRRTVRRRVCANL